MNTYELLENVLSHLPIKDLLRARAVDYQFSSIIGSSPKLRQNLFLFPRPDKDPKQWLVTRSKNAAVSMSDDLTIFKIPLGGLEDFYRKHTHIECHYAADCFKTYDSDWLTSPKILNPFLFQTGIAETYEDCAESNRKLRGTPDGRRRVQWTILRSLLVGGMGKMLLTQPPVRRAAVDMVYVHPAYNFDYVRIENKDGLTVDDVAEAIGEDRLASLTRCSVKFTNECPVFDFEKRYFDEKAIEASIEAEERSAGFVVLQALQDYSIE